ncbi:unnamed protein product [Sphagnum balticum]
MLELISCYLVVDQAYSNRAACYTKLGAFPEGLKDANKCIEFDPSFAKGCLPSQEIKSWQANGNVTGLKYHDGNQELMDGTSRCIEQINKVTRGDISAEDLKEKQVLTDLQQNPKAAQEHVKNPMVMGRIQKLVSAGIVQVRSC